MKIAVAAGLLLCTFLLHPAADAATKKRVSPCKVSHPSDDRIEWKCYRLKKKETLESLFGERWLDVARFNRIDRRHAWPGATLKVPVRLEEIKDFSPLPSEYPPAAHEEKFILVDLSEQFLGAYEQGRLVLSFPIASGDRTLITPTGEFRVTAFNRNHDSSLYKIEKTTTPYPMNYALRFLINERGVAFWIHGRDLPGYPASHGCIGLYDEEMQKTYYRTPETPLLDAAKTLYQWAIGSAPDDGNFHTLNNGPKVVIIGKSPL